MPTPSSDELTSVGTKLDQAQVPEDLKETVLNRVSRLSAAPFEEVERFLEYVDWIVSLPWEKTTGDLLDIEHAKAELDKNHFGMEQIKTRVLEYISVMKLQKGKVEKVDKVVESSLRAPVLCFVGLVGTGKTTISAAIAEALGRKFVRIPFGGLGEVATLRGEPRFERRGEPGQVIKGLRRSGVKNPVLLFDEIDRVEERARASIMGALVEILDPEQNKAFMDAYIDHPFDLSQVLFIATANNTNNIATAVLDRLEVIQMPSYTDQEKITIGRDFILPRVLSESGIDGSQVTISEGVWPMIVRPLGYDAGMRTLERTITGVVRKLAKLIVEGKGTKFELNESNIKEYLPTW